MIIELKDQYSSALQFLIAHRRIDATPKGLAPFLPHLTLGEIAALINKANKRKEQQFFAMPALVVEGTVLLASIEPRERIKGKWRPAYLTYWRARSVEEQRRGERLIYFKRALDFARKHWGKTLIKRTWKSHVQIRLQNPKDLDSRGYPCLHLDLWFVSAREWSDIAEDHSAPEHELIDASIIRITHLKSESDELRAGLDEQYTDYNCAHCGGGLDIAGCNSCKSRFEDNGSRNGWSTPLPAKLESYACNRGFHFAINPVLARSLQLAQWVGAKAAHEQRRLTELRKTLEAELAAAKQHEIAASGACGLADSRFNARKEELAAACKEFDDAAAAKARAEELEREQAKLDAHLFRRSLLGIAPPKAKTGKIKAKTAKSKHKSRQSGAKKLAKAVKGKGKAKTSRTTAKARTSRSKTNRRSSAKTR